MTEVRYSTQRLDHLGIVAGICDEIELVKHINRLVPASRRQVSIGHVVKALVLNALGFVSRPLYLTLEFFAQKPVEVLLGPGITAEMLNDDSIGRALDALFEAGLTEVFAQVASHALRHFGIEHRFVHLDFTSFHLHRTYAGQEDEAAGVMHITRGDSRDHRPDLKHVVTALITTYRSTVPTWIQALDGNTTDTQAIPQVVKAYLKQMREAETPYFVVDRALYSQANLHALADIRWITRVPRRMALVHYLERVIAVERMQPSALPGYRYLDVGTWYGDVRQRWVVVDSATKAARDRAALTQRLEKEKARAERAMRRLARQTFPSQEALAQAVTQTAHRWRYHQVTFMAQSQAHYAHRGRPRAGATPVRVEWRLATWEIRQNGQAVAEAQARCGKFMLATNELDAEALPADTILQAYKGQAVGPERGFRFLKDPLFFADSLFLKSPRRIMALIMIMGWALLVYALAERRVRQELVAREEYIPNQVGKPTQRPTMRRIFQLFEGIEVLVIHTPDGVQRQVTNLTALHRHILRLLGPAVEKYYTGPL